MVERGGDVVGAWRKPEHVNALIGIDSHIGGGSAFCGVQTCRGFEIVRLEWIDAIGHELFRFGEFGGHGPVAAWGVEQSRTGFPFGGGDDETGGEQRGEEGHG